MPSKAFTNHLKVVLEDANEIVKAHSALKTGVAGRQYGLGALNRAVVVMCISAWEVYVEEVLKETIELLKPDTPPLGTWPSLNASVRSAIGRFNNPNTQHCKEIFQQSLGLDDITQDWSWKPTTPKKVSKRLEEAIKLRHEIAHGTTPRPIVHNQQYAKRLPGFFIKLGECTDAGLTSYLQMTFNISTGWT